MNTRSMHTNQSKCPFCGAGTISETIEHQAFLYGDGLEQATISAEVPVLRCLSCNEEFTDYRAERSRHASVCKHLGRLTPEEVVDIRSRLSLSQDEFSILSGIGVASIKRWETGNQIQNLSMDCYLRLLRMPQNSRFLALLDRNRSIQPAEFVTSFNETTIDASRTFCLQTHKALEAA